MLYNRNTFVRPDTKMSVLIFENPSILLLLEHFGLDLLVKSKNAEQLCADNQIDSDLFITIANLYNGFKVAENKPKLNTRVLENVLTFLKNSHTFYLKDKIPEIGLMIEKMYNHHRLEEVKLIETFFADYAKEVREHLEYEDGIVFPYVVSLIQTQSEKTPLQTSFSLAEYREHHTDIETKLTDLKNLLVKHIELKYNPALKRKLLISLFELENDLNIHSVIEERILMPLIQELEKKNTGWTNAQ